jgi:O-antigen/teichoic acid export membrane protein
MFALHFLNKKVPPGAYGDFGVFLAVLMFVPTIPLQMVMAQQTAKALATNQQHQLAGMIRSVWGVLSLVWLAGAVVAAVFHRGILDQWKITDPTGFWVVLPLVLISLWAPLFQGVLQGQQNFLWLGWSLMSNGIFRVSIAAFAVLALAAGATGMLAGVMAGSIASVLIALWHSRALWLATPAPFDRRGFLRQVLPLLLGFSAFQFLFTADTMFAKGYFSSTTMDFYFCAGTMSRALMWLVGPLAAVMFPRLVHSAARSEKSDLMGLVLLGTAVLGVLGAVSVSLVGPWIVRFAYSEAYVKVASSLFPWYAGAMIPLTLANVLLNNLMARGSGRLAWSLVLLAAGYGFALTRFHATPIAVLQTMGVANLVLFATCAWFTWGVKVKGPKVEAQRMQQAL